MRKNKENKLLHSSLSLFSTESFNHWVATTFIVDHFMPVSMTLIAAEAENAVPSGILSAGSYIIDFKYDLLHLSFVHLVTVQVFKTFGSVGGDYECY